MESSGFSIYMIVSSANRDDFDSSFLIWMPFISLCYLIILARSGIMLNRSGEDGHPCLISDS